MRLGREDLPLRNPRKDPDVTKQSHTNQIKATAKPHWRLKNAQTAPATPGTTWAPSAQPSPDWPRPILGVNLESLKDHERQFMFIDAIKTSRKWGSAQKPYDQQGPMGEDGWPSGDAGTLVVTE